MSAFLLRFKSNYRDKNQSLSTLPQFFFVDSSSPCKDLLFPRGPNLAQKPLYLVGTALSRSQDHVLQLSILASP